MRKSVASFLIITLISLTVKADYVSDCKDALKAADALISDLKQEIDVRKALEKQQTDMIVQLTLQNNEKSDALASPLRNPFIVGGIGISIGAIAVLLLKK